VPDTSTAGLSRRIREVALDLGFDGVGLTRIRPSDHVAFYRSWIEAGRHGGMDWLARHDAVARRTDPCAAWPDLQTAIVLASAYRSPDDAAARSSIEDERRGGFARDPGPGPAAGIIARYARGRDYHTVLKARLLRLLRAIEEMTGHELPAARAYVDTGPLLERELARRAGLGWFGRNTMLIHPRRGSYFFIACLLVEIELAEDAPFEEDHCGTCNACVEACPTGALLGRDANGAPVMDARTCISYLTIEERGPIARDLRPLIGNRIFGCDICQEVCPWNEGRGSVARMAQRTTADSTLFARETPPAVQPLDRPDLVRLMSMDEEAWDAFSRGTAVRRAKRAGFLRNVAIALGNSRDPAAVPALVAALHDGEPLVRGHAAWALGEIGTADGRKPLRTRLSIETDAFVRREVMAALEILEGRELSSPSARRTSGADATEFPGG
jgi:epoxyqueuosine reductase